MTRGKSARKPEPGDKHAFKCPSCKGSGVVRLSVTSIPCGTCNGKGGRSRKAEHVVEAAGIPIRPGKKWLYQCVTRFADGWSIDACAAWSGHSQRDIEDEIRRAFVGSLRRKVSRERHEREAANLRGAKRGHK